MRDAADDSEATRNLLREIELGNRKAFDSLFARHRALLRRLVELRLDPKLRSRVDASDVVQEAQLEAFRRLDDFLERRPMPFRLWLCKTAHERLLMSRRQHVEAARRSVGRELPLPEKSSVMLGEQLMASGASPSRQYAQHEMARRVREAVSRLPEIAAEILLMRNFEGLSYEEVGYILDIEPAAARKRHGRALLQLHKLLAEDGLTESQI
jgi:RNA polymerase sigma-70 factor (ECF subfamily)